ncbi:TPA: class I SAM-dependent methyltransferase, partial [Candidatus Poribacteria bacterium]|nr:class I SAM-dependent methyltransferase [Candidatus Poribacteria bacterium]
MNILYKIPSKIQTWMKYQMNLTDKSSQNYRNLYDNDILNQGVEFQIENYYEPSDKLRIRRLKMLLGVLSPCEKNCVLDVGCGVGTFAFYSAKKGAYAVGVDYSMESIKIARLLSQRYKPAVNPFFLVADATKLPFNRTPFNKVICADFIEHISDVEKEQVLDEIMRVMDSGTIIVYTPNYIRELIAFLINHMKSVVTQKKTPVNVRHFGLTTRTKFEKILRKYDSISINFRY